MISEILSPIALLQQLSAFKISLEVAWQLTLVKIRTSASKICLKDDFLMVRMHKMKQA